MAEHDLFHFMTSLRSDLERDYQRIRKRTRQDPGTAGDEAEESWAALLRGWLPPSYHVVTKGRIVNADGEASPQLDVLVLRPEYPKALLNKKIYMAGGTAAAFECKLTLEPRHLNKIFRTAYAVKNLIPTRSGTPYEELHQPIQYGVLAHSHGWGRKARHLELRVLDSIENYALDYCEFPRDQADIFCIADTGTYVLSHNILTANNVSNEEKAELFGNTPPFEAVHSGYFCQWEEEDRPYMGTNLGALLCHIWDRLAFEDAMLRPLAEYISNTGIISGRIGRPNLWMPTVLTDNVMAQVRENGFDEDRWSKWRSHF